MDIPFKILTHTRTLFNLFPCNIHSDTHILNIVHPIKNLSPCYLIINCTYCATLWIFLNSLNGLISICNSSIDRVISLLDETYYWLLIYIGICRYKIATKTFQLFFFCFSLFTIHNLHYKMADLPDFMTDPNAVLNDKDHEWRYNRIPDYKKVNAAYEEGKLTRFCVYI
jgi:hypothetical protein